LTNIDDFVDRVQNNQTDRLDVIEEIAHSNMEDLKYYQKQLNKTTHYMESIEDALQIFFLLWSTRSILFISFWYIVL